MRGFKIGCDILLDIPNMEVPNMEGPTIDHGWARTIQEKHLFAGPF
jgi:hypothetical protein